MCDGAGRGGAVAAVADGAVHGALGPLRAHRAWQLGSAAGPGLQQAPQVQDELLHHAARLGR